VREKVKGEKFTNEFTTFYDYD